MYTTDPFQYRDVEPFLLKMEAPDVDLNFTEPHSASFGDPFAMLDSPSSTILPSPVHLNFTESFVNWNASGLATGHHYAPTVGRVQQFHGAISQSLSPELAVPGHTPQQSLEVLREWHQLQQHNNLPGTSAIMPLQGDFQAPEPTTPNIKLEDESSSPYSSDYSIDIDELPWSTSIGVLDFTPSFQPKSQRSRPSSRPDISRRHSGGIGRHRTKAVKNSMPTQSSRQASEQDNDSTSKSNYERILDGSVSSVYPEGFTAKVLSKRIAHKLSEKSRRNRLTTAIRKIEKLLPPAMLAEVRDRSKGKNAPGAAPADAQNKTSRPALIHISKVDIAEMALEYIRQLRQDLESAKKREVSGSS